MEILTKEQLEVLSIEEISKVIANAKRNASRIKNKMEAPIYDNIEKYSERIELLKNLRVFILDAVKVLKSKGGNYKKSAIEIQDEEFNKSLINASKIHFAFDGPKYNDDSIFVDLTVDPPIILRAMSKNIREIKHKWNKDSFLKDFKQLHVGEWLDEYSLKRFGLKNIGGSHWQLTIEYLDGKRKIMRGACAYPYNFDELLSMFRIK